jgi:hypothetical protein
MASIACKNCSDETVAHIFSTRFGQASAASFRRHLNMVANMPQSGRPGKHLLKQAAGQVEGTMSNISACSGQASFNVLIGTEAQSTLHLAHASSPNMILRVTKLHT